MVLQSILRIRKKGSSFIERIKYETYEMGLPSGECSLLCCEKLYYMLVLY